MESKDFYSPLPTPHSSLEFGKRDGLFAGVAFAAEDGVADDDGFLFAVAAGVEGEDEGGGLDMVLANGTAAKATGSVGGAVAVDTVHEEVLKDELRIMNYEVTVSLARRSARSRWVMRRELALETVWLRRP